MTSNFQPFVNRKTSNQKVSGFGGQQMSSRSNEPRRPRKKMDPLYYAGYFDDDVPVKEIEQMFAMYGETVKEGASPEEAARQVFLQTAKPSQIPLDVWFALGDGEDGEYDDDDEYSFSPTFGGDDGDDVVPRGRGRFGPRGKRVRGTAGQPTMASAAQIEHLGAGVDLWPAYKVKQVGQSGGVIRHKELMNRVKFKKRSDFVKKLASVQYHVVDRIDVKTFRSIVGGQCDAILMDPPFGYAGWTYKRFNSFLTKLKPHLDRCFIVVWVSPDHMDGVMEAFKQAEFKFCDSMAVELLDPYERPYVIRSDWHGLPRDSRMAMMYRTTDIVRSDLKQQRVKDTGFGIVAEGAKTYGRLSMPMTIHNIIKVMLPPRKGNPRVFVELWPSFWHRKKGWTLIDERPVHVKGEPVELESLPWDPNESFD